MSRSFWQIHRPEFQGFAVEFFTVLWISWNLARLSLVFIFKISAHDFLAFRVIWKQACLLDISILLKPCFYGQTSERWNFFARFMKFFFLILASFHIQKTSESIRPFCRRNPTWVNNLNNSGNSVISSLFSLQLAKYVLFFKHFLKMIQPFFAETFRQISVG